MPPKAKFTKNEIVDAAMQIVREQGLEAVTSRELGKRLGSSACPIFTVFSNMEEVKSEIIMSTNEKLNFISIFSQWSFFIEKRIQNSICVYAEKYKKNPHTNCVYTEKIAQSS